MYKEVSNSASELGKSALYVRDQAKYVGRAVLKLEKPTSCMIIGRSLDDNLVCFTREVCRHLIDSFKKTLTVYVEQQLEKHPRFQYEQMMSKCPLVKERLRFWTVEYCRNHPETIDFIITLGGDGTVLYASWLFQHSQVPPVIPFHMGSLGFLTVFNTHDICKVLEDTVGCKGNGKRVNLRMRLCCTIHRDGFETQRENSNGFDILFDSLQSPKKPLVSSSPARECTGENIELRMNTFHILNDLVIDRGPSAYMSQLELFVEGEHLTTVQADGLVVATPTGSTAYSLAAGGSLVHPEVPSFLLTPICAHSLSFRPMLLPDSIELKIQVPLDSRNTAWASFDGRHRTELKQGDYITVELSRWPMPSVCLGDQSMDWFNSLKTSLHWNQRTRQKPFANGNDSPSCFDQIPDTLPELSELAHLLFE